VFVPLAVAVGWLFWRLRGYVRQLALYLLAVATLVALIRIALVAWHAGEEAFRAGMRGKETTCIDPRGAPVPLKPKAGCWL
jgi:hypothetical protein